MTGGYPPYNYLWSTGANSGYLEGLVAGVYYFTVSDQIGTMVYDSFAIEVSGMVLSFDVSAASDPYITDGYIDLSISFGNPPYSYSWSTGATSEDVTVSGGVYCLTVSDQSNCMVDTCVTVLPLPLCDPVVNLRANGVTFDGAMLRWDAQPSAESYIVEGGIVGASAPGSSNAQRVPVPNNQANASGLLVPGRIYWWHVQVVCNTSDSLMSSWSMIDTFNTPVCEPPGGTNSVNITHNSARLTWLNTFGAIGYVLRGRRIGANSWTTVTSGNNQVNTGQILQSSTCYEWQVRSDCSNAGLSSWSPLVNFCTDCGIPYNLQAIQVTASSALLQWETVNSLIDHTVEIRMVSGGAATTVQVPTGAKSVNLNNLPGCTQLQYRVIGYCGPENTDASLWSEWFDFSTECSKVEDLSISQFGEFQKEQLKIVIWPNPTSGQMFVKVVNGPNEMLVRFSMYNSLGEVIWQHEAITNGFGRFEDVIDLSGIPAGMYTMNVRINNTLSSLRVILN